MTGAKTAETKVTKTDERIAVATDFLEKVRRDISKDNGAKATLKRALTGEPRHLRATYPILWRYLGGIKDHQDEWIFVACLFASDHEQPLNFAKRRNFGNSAGILDKKIDSGGPERRFKALLDTSVENLHSPLSALVRLLKKEGIAIDYPKLIVDLCRWEHPDQFVQDEWAKAFWGASPPEEQSSQNTEDSES
jgi:CRISPR system Cascade subunit CasB